MLTTTKLAISKRPRRTRKSAALRALVQERRLHVSDLVYPLFVCEQKSSIGSMPGIYRHNPDGILREIERCMELGILGFALFPVIDSALKDDVGSEGLKSTGLLYQTIQKVKEHFPEVCLISDVALDPYTSHGHDGVIDESGEVLNDETVELLIQMAKVQAAAGIDLVAPSDMMDGRVAAIRRGLDENGFTHVGILSYAAKYASSFYGPYREAVASAHLVGNKKSYQLNPANQREALLEAALDESEGADILMVKPALAYLDILAKLRERTHLPLAAYQVSGEYAMLVAAAEKGWLDLEEGLLESVLSIKRAGADMIFTYAAPQLATSGALY